MTLHSTYEVAAKLHVSKQTVTKLIRDGKIEARKVGRLYMVTAEAIEKYSGIVGIMTTETN
jgi:excisionase family DNA binding protein